MKPISPVTSCSFEDASLNHLRDALAMTHEQRWRWLIEAIDFGFAVARSRALQGQITLGPHGEVIWSPEAEEQCGRVSIPSDLGDRVG